MWPSWRRRSASVSSRAARAVALTPEGGRFHVQAREILSVHDAALAQVHGLEPDTPTLRLAVIDHAVGGRLTGALKRLGAVLPRATIEVVIGSSAEMRAAYDAAEAVVRQDADRREGTPLRSLSPAACSR